GSLGAPWPLVSLGVTPSSEGYLNWLVKSIPTRKVGLFRPFSKMELPSMALPMFGCPEADTGLPKTATPPVPLNSTRLPAPAAVPPMRLKETPGSLGCAGPRGGLKVLELHK